MPDDTFKLCVVVSSIGRSDRLEGLLESLRAQTTTNFVLGVCDQSKDGIVRRIVGAEPDLGWFVTTSEPGLSAGRNSVIRAAPSDVTHFAFPNDTSRLAPDFVDAIHAHAATADIIAVSYVHDGKSRYRFPAGTSAVDRSNVWNISEAAMVLSRDLLNQIVGFREDLGTGSTGWWQSGEGTDLLLRAIKCRCWNAVWAPEIKIGGVSEGFGLSNLARRQKLRSYGRGYLCVLVDHKYSLVRIFLAIAAPACRGAMKRKIDFRDGCYTSLGRLEGAIRRAWETRSSRVHRGHSA
jgi:hypothetical protein